MLRWDTRDSAAVEASLYRPYLPGCFFVLEAMEDTIVKTMKTTINEEGCVEQCMEQNKEHIEMKTKNE